MLSYKVLVGSRRYKHDTYLDGSKILILYWDQDSNPIIDILKDSI